MLRRCFVYLSQFKSNSFFISLFLRRQVIDKLLSNKMTRIVVVFADRTQVGWGQKSSFGRILVNLCQVSVTRSLLIGLRQSGGQGGNSDIKIGTAVPHLSIKQYGEYLTCLMQFYSKMNDQNSLSKASHLLKVAKRKRVFSFIWMGGSTLLFSSSADVYHFNCTPPLFHERFRPQSKYHIILLETHPFYFIIIIKSRFGRLGFSQVCRCRE